jgi:hypothetical protein
MRRATIRLASALVAWIPGGCAFEPIPLVARAGTTILLPVSSEWPSGSYLGYESEVTRSFGYYDDQRGELVFVLREDPNEPGPEYPLVNRFVTRVYPDPASFVGMRDGTLDGDFSQVLALLDVPADTPAGRYFIEVRRRRRANAERTAFEPLVAPGQGLARLEVLAAEIDPETGSFIESFTPARAIWGWRRSAEQGMLELYPWPKLVLRISAGWRVPAARIVLRYPPLRVGVMAVVEDMHSSSGSIVRWSDSDPPGEITIDVVDPDRTAQNLGVVFAMADPFGAGPLEISDFVVVESRHYDDAGDLLPYGGHGSIAVEIR